MNSTGKPEFPSRRNFLLASAGLALAPAPALTQSLGRQEQPDIDLVLARRRQYLKEIKELVPPTLTRVMESKKLGDRINAYDKTWEDWVDRVGELPPDFESMPSIPHIPDPLLLDEDGRETPITTKMGAVARFNPGASQAAFPALRSRHHGIGVRRAEFGHPVENVTPDQGLSLLRVAVPRLQVASEH